MARSVAIPTPDDGETLGALLRPSGGFVVVKDADHVPGGEGATQGRPWLVPQGKSEMASWPRSDPEWLKQFSALHRESDEDVAAFAGRFGWLRPDTFDAADPGRRPGRTQIAGVNADQPVWADSVRAWQDESLVMADLLTVLDAARILEEGQETVEKSLEAARRRIVAHFSGPGGATLWRRRGDHLRPPDKGKDWRVEPGPDPCEVTSIAFLYGRPSLGLRRATFVPVPFRAGPRRGSSLAMAEPRELATLARHALAAVVQGVLSTETSGVLTLGDAIRVMPRSLLGALYLSLGRELFNRRTAKICPVCREPFTPRQRNQDYCNRGTGCRSKAYRQRRDQAARRTLPKS